MVSIFRDRHLFGSMDNRTEDCVQESTGRFELFGKVTRNSELNGFDRTAFFLLLDGDFGHRGSTWRICFGLLWRLARCTNQIKTTSMMIGPIGISDTHGLDGVALPGRVHSESRILESVQYELGFWTDASVDHSVDYKSLPVDGEPGK